MRGEGGRPWAEGGGCCWASPGCWVRSPYLPRSSLGWAARRRRLPPGGATGASHLRWLLCRSVRGGQVAELGCKGSPGLHRPGVGMRGVRSGSGVTRLTGSCNQAGMRSKAAVHSSGCRQPDVKLPTEEAGGLVRKAQLLSGVPQAQSESRETYYPCMGDPPV